MSKASNYEELIGSQTKEKCPKCEKGRLFTNKRGNKWCSSIECNYHVDSCGQQKRIPISLLTFGVR
jgi:uncharacterized protein (DUF983 family)